MVPYDIPLTGTVSRDLWLSTCDVGFRKLTDTERCVNQTSCFEDEKKEERDNIAKWRYVCDDPDGKIKEKQTAKCFFS